MSVSICSLCTHQPLKTYLADHQLTDNESHIGQQIHQLLIQKQQRIHGLEALIIKLKAENSKNNKIITQLQQKISQMCPNMNNTGSNFMMTSQFKDFFDDFMKNCLPTCLSPLLHYPEAYSKYSSVILSSVYSQINLKLNEKLTNICKILQLDTTPQNLSKLRLSLLKIFQQNWKYLLLPPATLYSQPKLSPFILSLPQYQNPQILQIISSQQYKQLDQKLIHICCYMLLQQKKWEFIIPKITKLEKYNKKDYICIDGWIKDKQDVILVLEGLMRENQEGHLVRHPNLKNYVIPYLDEHDDHPYTLIQKSHIDIDSSQKQPKQDNIYNDTINKTLKVDQYSQYSPKITYPFSTNILKFRQQQTNKQNIMIINTDKLIQSKIDSSYSSLKQKNKKQYRQSKEDKILEQHQQHQHKIQTAIRKISKCQPKMPQSIIETDSISIFLSPHMIKGGVKNSQQNSNHTLRLNNIQNINDNQMIGNPSSSLVKSSKIKNTKKNTYNLISDPSFQQIIQIPHKKRDIISQLPLKRQLSKTKKSNSRKVSAGKIVGQTIQSKQINLGNKNNREYCSGKQKDKDNKQNINKQTIYKDIIKQKLGTEHKTERNKESKHKDKDKDRDRDRDRDRDKEQEDRPLKMMKKIRQKYLNL